jgi:MFS family permease
MGKIRKGNSMNYPQIFVLGFGFFGVSLIWSLYNAFVPIFLQGFAMSSMMIGFIMTFDNILAVILQPYIGFLSDNTRTKMGKRKPFILIGAPLGALFFMLIPFMKNINIFWFIGAIILMNLAMALFRSPVVALMPDIVPSKDRSKANGVVNFMGGFGGLLAFFVGGILFDMNTSMPFVIGAVALLVSSVLVLILVKEPNIKIKKGETVEKVNFSAAFKSLFKSLKELFVSKDKSELFILLAIFFWFCGFGTLETFFTIYGTQYLEMTAGNAAFALGLFSLMFMLFAIPAGFIGNKFGRKKTIMAGLIILIICLFSVSMISADSITSETVVSGISVLDEIYRIPRASEFFMIQSILVIGGIGWAFININSLPMVVDMVSEDKVGGHTGLYYFFSMMAAIIAPPLVGAVIDYLSYPSMIKFSVLSFLCALFCIIFVRKGEAKKGVV